MATAKYVDGFIIVMPKSKIAAYKKMATLASKVWKDHGALDYKECVGEDLKVPHGNPFPKLARAKSHEVVIFSWITYKSKSHRNSVNKKVMKDPRIAEQCDPKKMPFEMKKMSYGGFKILVQS